MIITILVASLAFSYLRYRTIEGVDKLILESKILEFWNNFVNYFIAGLIGYYLVTVRLPQVSEGNVAAGPGDIFLFTFFLMGSFGHLAVLSYNLTRAIEAILQKFFASN
jgi:hypothetical protein